MLTKASRRFKFKAEKLGCRIVKVSNKINGVITQRPDIRAVMRRNEWVMTIPRHMYAVPNRGYKDLGGRPHPDYFICEKILMSKFYAPIKTT
jgi:hypothetical protein